VIRDIRFSKGGLLSGEIAEGQTQTVLIQE
jgi:hypothetical protein